MLEICVSITLLRCIELHINYYLKIKLQILLARKFTFSEGYNQLGFLARKFKECTFFLILIFQRYNEINLRDNRLIFFEALLNLTSSLDRILTTGGGVEELTLMLVTKLECEDIINLLEAISASFSASSLRYKSSNSSVKERIYVLARKFKIQFIKL